jgi:hypothetical protein
MPGYLGVDQGHDVLIGQSTARQFGFDSSGVKAELEGGDEILLKPDAERVAVNASRGLMTSGCTNNSSTGPCQRLKAIAVLTGRRCGLDIAGDAADAGRDAGRDAGLDAG